MCIYFLNFSGLLSTHMSIIWWFLCLEDLQDKAVFQAVSSVTRTVNRSMLSICLGLRLMVPKLRSFKSKFGQPEKLSVFVL